MKKTIYLFIAAVIMVSCGSSYKATDVVLNDVQDSVNFALGYVNGSMLKMQQLQEDSSDAVIAEFIDALQRGYDGKVEELSEVASVGKNIGFAIKSFEKNGLAENASWQLNEKVLFQGLVNGLNEDTTIMKSDVAKQFFQSQYQASMMASDSVKADKAIRSQCPDKAKTIELKNFTDSINYAFGLMNGSDIKMYLLASDSTGEEKKDFIKQINKALKMKIKSPQLMNMGEQIGKTIKDQEATGLVGEPKLETNFALIKQGFINGMKGHDTQFNQQTAGEYISNTINGKELGMLTDLYETYHYDVPTILIAAEYCNTLGKYSVHYLSKLLMDWYEHDLCTYDEVEAEIIRRTEYNTYESTVRRCFGLTNKLTTKQTEYVEKWKQCGIDESLLNIACEKCLDGTGGKINFKYIDQVISSWVNKGIKTPEQVAADDASHKGKNTKFAASAKENSFSVEKLERLVKNYSSKSEDTSQ